MSVFLSNIDILDLSIPQSLIFYIFIAIGGAAFLLFIFNLIFKRTSRKKKVISESDLLQKRNFEISKNDIETEITLVLKVENKREKYKEYADEISTEDVISETKIEE